MLLEKAKPYQKNSKILSNVFDFATIVHPLLVLNRKMIFPKKIFLSICHSHRNMLKIVTLISSRQKKRAFQKNLLYLFVTCVLKHVEYVNIIRIRNIIILWAGWVLPPD